MPNLVLSKSFKGKKSSRDTLLTPFSKEVRLRIDEFSAVHF